MPIKGGGAAFPKSVQVQSDPGLWVSIPETADGMTLRDYFAAKALAGIGGAHMHSVVFHVELGGVVRDPVKGEAARLAATAYAIADAMLEQREK